MKVVLRSAIAAVLCASSAYAQQRDPEIVAIRVAAVGFEVTM